jgi:hypothetical protein
MKKFLVLGMLATTAFAGLNAAKELELSSTGAAVKSVENNVVFVDLADMVLKTKKYQKLSMKHEKLNKEIADLAASKEKYMEGLGKEVSAKEAAGDIPAAVSKKNFMEKEYKTVQIELDYKSKELRATLEKDSMELRNDMVASIQETAKKQNWERVKDLKTNELYFEAEAAKKHQFAAENLIVKSCDASFATNIAKSGLASAKAAEKRA